MKKNVGTRFALAGLGTALSVIFIALAYFVRNLSLSFTALAAIGIMLPLTKNYYREALLTCIASGIIGFFIANINVLSFVLASSFYIVFTVFWHNRNLSKVLGYCIKAAYSFLVFFILYKAVTLITIDFSLLPKLGALHPSLLYILLNALFTIAFLVYDILMVQVYLYLKKIMSKMVK